jgi:uncharacterized protein
MNRETLITKTEEFVKQSVSQYDSGHDWWHIDRVRRLSFIINGVEKTADPFALEIAALLHDSADSKFRLSENDSTFQRIEMFLEKPGLADIKKKVLNVINNVSFSKKDKKGDLQMPELLIIQDADKLDAIGAIGIARAFNYGGFRHNAIHIPEGHSGEKFLTTINHFYDKLLKLRDMMNTAMGRRIAEERHAFLEIFLEQFYKEWDTNY